MDSLVEEVDALLFKLGLRTQVASELEAVLRMPDEEKGGGFAVVGGRDGYRVGEPHRWQPDTRGRHHHPYGQLDGDVGYRWDDNDYGWR